METVTENHYGCSGCSARRVDAFNPNDHPTLATVPVGSNPLDVAVNSLTHTAYVSYFGNSGGCGFSGGGSVTVILNQRDHSFTVKATITLGGTANALGIDLNPATNRGYVANCPQIQGTVGTVVSGAVTVINGTSDTIITTIIPCPPCIDLNDIAVDPVTNTIYAIGNAQGSINGVFTNYIEIFAIDGSTNMVAHNFIIAGACLTNGGGFANIADNPATNTVWLDGTQPCGGSSYLWALNGSTGTVKAAIQVASTCSFPCDQLRGIGVNSISNIIYVADGNDFVWVYSGSTYGLVNTLDLTTATCCPEDVTIDPATNRIYVSEDLLNEVTVIAGA